MIGGTRFNILSFRRIEMPLERRRILTAHAILYATGHTKQPSVWEYCRHEKD